MDASLQASQLELGDYGRRFLGRKEGFAQVKDAVTLLAWIQALVSMAFLQSSVRNC